MADGSHVGPGGYKITPIDRKKKQTGGIRGSTDTVGAKAVTTVAGGNKLTGEGANRAAWDNAGGTWRSSNDYYDLAMAGAQPLPQPFKQGGGGGGGGRGASPDFAAYSAAMMKLLNSSLMNGPADPMVGKIDPAVNADIATAKAAYGNLASQIPTTDPYLSLVGQAAPTVDPGMEQFLHTQGVPTDPYGNAVDYANAQLAAGANNWSNYGQAMGTSHVAAQKAMQNTAAVQGENIVQGLEGQRTSMNEALALRQYQVAQQAQQQKLQIIMQLLGQGLQYGQMPNLQGVI